MSTIQKRVLWPSLVAVIALAFTVFVFVEARTRRPSKPPVTSGPSSHLSQTTRIVPRNLSLQPEALNLSRRLGQRFSPVRRETSVLTGTLTIGTDQRVVNIVRRQNDKGENVEIAVIGSLNLLTWDASQGALSSGARASGSDRELIEKLVFDSPDQFVLAQLRGASYFTIARTVRPVNAGENYAGPLWNIIRVDDPDNDETRRPQSRWRLYYVNAVTGLIDRIESEVQGQRILAEVSGWTDLNGEKVATQVVWKRDGRTLMQYALTNFSRVEE